MKPTPIPRYLDNDTRSALEGLDVNKYSQGVSSLTLPRKRRAWQAFWERAIMYGTEANLDQLQRTKPEFCPQLGVLNVMFALMANNTSTLGWLLSHKDFMPNGSLRRGEMTENEVIALKNSCNLAFSEAQDRSPIFAAASLLVQRCEDAISDVNRYHVLRSLRSAYNAGDIDSFCTLWRATEKIGHHPPDGSPGRMWVHNVLYLGSYSDILKISELRETHSDFARLYDSQFPLTTHSANYSQQLTSKNSWEYILISGGASAADLLTRPDSPFPDFALRCLDNKEFFKSFLSRMVNHSSGLVNVLNHNEDIRKRFFEFTDTNGENSLHVILNRMPHHSAKLRTTRLTMWLDKNAREMFEKPFADGTSVAEKIQDIDPLWLVRARRNRLKEIASKANVKRASTPQVKM